MDGHREIDSRSKGTGPTGLDDASLDREIESLLASEPSPEFLARVRTRVAQEPEPGRWRASWMFAAATAIAAVVVALIAWPSSEVTPASHAPIERPRMAEAAPAVVSSSVSSQPVRRPVAVKVVAAVERDRAIDIDLPQVVIAENEVNTFTSLVASLRQSRFDVAVPVAPNPDAPLEIKELAPVEPLEIEPIVRVAVLQTEGERP
jgi:hypothetical protein